MVVVDCMVVVVDVGSAESEELDATLSTLTVEAIVVVDPCEAELVVVLLEAEEASSVKLLEAVEVEAADPMPLVEVGDAVWLAEAPELLPLDVVLRTEVVD